MMTQAASCETLARSRPFGTVAIVTDDPYRDVVQTALNLAQNSIIVVESTATAYSQIKRMRPDVVIVCLANDGTEACQVLSMLTLDSETSGIPVVTWLTEPSDGPADSESQENSIFGRAAHMPLN